MLRKDWGLRTDKIFWPVAIIRHGDYSTVESHEVSSLTRTVDGPLPRLPGLELVDQPVVHLGLAGLHVLSAPSRLEFSDVFTKHLLSAPAQHFLGCVVTPDDLELWSVIISLQSPPPWGGAFSPCASCPSSGQCLYSSPGQRTNHELLSVWNKNTNQGSRIFGLFRDFLGKFCNLKGIWGEMSVFIAMLPCCSLDRSLNQLDDLVRPERPWAGLHDQLVQAGVEMVDHREFIFL